MKNKIKISRLQENDYKLFVELIELLNEVFEESNSIASKKQLKKLLTKKDFHAIVPSKNDKIVGGLTAYELEKYYNDRSELYIYDIAVKTELHNQGIGKELMNYVKDYSIKKGIEAIFVQAYSEEEQAVKFYESTIGKGENVNHFNFIINTTRNK